MVSSQTSLTEQTSAASLANNLLRIPCDITQLQKTQNMLGRRDILWQIGND